MRVKLINLRGEIIRLLTILWILMALGGPLAADEVKQLTGYVELQTKGGAEPSEPSVEVFLRKPLLRMVAGAVRLEDEEFADVLDKLQLIQVRVFEGAKAVGMEDVLGRIVGRLEKEQWEKVVRIREEGEHVDLYLKLDDTNIAGLFVAVVEGKRDEKGNRQKGEVVLVNIVGDIDSAELGRIGSKFNIEPLEGLNLGNKDGSAEGK